MEVLAIDLNDGMLHELKVSNWERIHGNDESGNREQHDDDDELSINQSIWQ